MVTDACSRSVAGRWRSSEGKSSHSVFDESSDCSRSEDFEKESELYSCVGEKGKRTERSGVSASNGTRSGRRDLEAWRNTSVHRTHDACFRGEHRGSQICLPPYPIHNPCPGCFWRRLRLFFFFW